MSTDNDVARSLRSWLREDRYEDADRVLDVVFDQIPATPQRSASWLARRFPIMNSNMFRGHRPGVRRREVPAGLRLGRRTTRRDRHAYA